MKPPPFNMEGFSAAQTVFYSTPGKRAVLVKNEGGKRRTQQLTFADPHAALAWCLAHGAALVYWPEAGPERN